MQRVETYERKKDNKRFVVEYYSDGFSPSFYAEGTKLNKNLSCVKDFKERFLIIEEKGQGNLF